MTWEIVIQDIILSFIVGMCLYTMMTVVQIERKIQGLGVVRLNIGDVTDFKMKRVDDDDQEH